MTLLGLHLHFQGFLFCVSKSYHVNWQRPQNAKGEAQVVSKIRVEAPSLKKCDSNLIAPLHPKKMHRNEHGHRKPPFANKHF